MAKIFPSIFPYDLDSPEMQKLGIQVEYEVYNKLKKLSNEFEIFCSPKFIKKNVKFLAKALGDINIKKIF